MKRVNAMMSGIIDEKKIDEKKIDDEVYKLEKEILNQDKPNIWNVHTEGNMERILEVDFQKFAISVVELTGMDINKITTFTFYASVEHLKDKHKKQ